MKIVEKRLDEIRPYERNPRRNDAAVEYVANSLREFGWKQPIVIDKNGVIVAGHTRYKAALSLGWTTAPCLVADDLTPEQIKAYRLADNKVSDYSVWDNKLLLEELNELCLIDEELFTGFDISELFNDALDEADVAIMEENTAGVVYEVVFKSENSEKIDRIREAWEKIDNEYGFRFGPLSYRSLRFETDTLDTPNFQGNAVVNYTDADTPWTRIIEHKWFQFGKDELGNDIPATVISREYPAEWKPGDEPFYPVNDPENETLFARYKELANVEPKTIFGGRLGEYKYYDMDKAVASALKLAADHT